MEISSEAATMLTQILPVMLHFMADEYDDTCSTIFPLLSNILSNVCFTVTFCEYPLTSSS